MSACIPLGLSKILRLDTASADQVFFAQINRIAIGNPTNSARPAIPCNL